MMTYRCSLMAALCLLLPLAVAHAQLAKDKSRALLRQDPDTAMYYVESQLEWAVPSPASLTASLRHERQTIQRTADIMLCAPRPTAYGNYLRLRAAAHLSPEEKKLRICEGQTTAPWRFYFWLPTRPASNDKYVVTYDFADAANENHSDSMTAVTDFEAAIDNGFQNCRKLKGEHPDLHLNEPKGVVLRFKWRESLAPPALANGDAAPVPEWDAEYIRARPAMIFNQLKASNAVVMEVEPREDDVQEMPVTFDVIWLGYSPSTAAVAGASQGFAVCVEPAQRLPAGEFHARLSFTNGPPAELLKPLIGTLKTPVIANATRATVGEFAEKDKLGVRTLGSNLDLAVAASSSVVDVEKEVEGAKTTARERQHKVTLDLIYAPVLQARRGKPTVGTFTRYVTPFFLDAKISNGKINKDSLSVNRFVLGHEHEWRSYRGTELGQRDIFRFFLRGLHTSDRDLKRPEVKGQFEFRPVFDVVNKPLEYEYFTTVIDTQRKEDKKRLKRHFGFFLQPFVGVEAGRTYRQGRTPFVNEEVGRNVWRAFFGTDITINATEKVTLTLRDTFYVRGEAHDDRGHNYFKGEFDFFFSDRETESGQSLFFSFERGNLPPFATKDANVFKVGYRIRSILGRPGSAR